MAFDQHRTRTVLGKIFNQYDDERLGLINELLEVSEFQVALEFFCDLLVEEPSTITQQDYEVLMKVAKEVNLDISYQNTFRKLVR